MLFVEVTHVIPHIQINVGYPVLLIQSWGCFSQELAYHGMVTDY